MKKILKGLSLLIILNIFTHCVQDDDYKVPSNLGQVENQDLNALLTNATELSIQQVKNIFVDGNSAVQITSNVYVKGYVSSSDESGNFYQEFYIQDTPENPSAAIKVSLAMTDIFERYNQGREVFIQLQNMYVGEVREGDGVVTVGENENVDGEIEPFRENVAIGYTGVNNLGESTQYSGRILRSSITENLLAKPLTLATVGQEHIGMFVSVEAQFPDDLNGALFVDSADAFDTTRALQTCVAYGYGASNFVLETSTFANFKDIPLPTGSGTVSGIISKNYNGSYLVMNLNNVTDVNCESSRCTVQDVSLFHTVFEENLDSATHNTDFDFTDWINYKEAGNRVWREKQEAGNGYAEFTAYNSGDSSNIGWLISPPLNLDTQTNDVLTFKTAQHHLSSLKNTVKVYVSTNFDGINVLSATWEPLGAKIASDLYSWYEWVDSGLIDVSDYNGTVHFAFQYIGSGINTNLDGTLRIDDFKLEGI